MSHRAFDAIAGLRQNIAALEDEIAAAKAGPVIDLKALADLRRRREEMIAHLTREHEVLA